MERTTDVKATEPYQTSDEDCVPDGKNPKDGVIIKSSCPDSYNGSSLVKRKCIGTNDPSDPFVGNLLTDSSTKTTFKNIYCAECNNAPLEDLRFWNILMYCKTLLPHKVSDDYVRGNLKYRKGTNMWGVMFNKSFHQCELYFKKPDSLKVNQCSVEHTLDCPTTWHQKSLNACKSCINDEANSYTLFCQICRFTDAPCRRISTRSETKKREPRLFSFALLLDVNRSDGDLVGYSIVKFPKCDRGVIYDPFFKKCRPLVCAIPGFKMSAEYKCVRINKHN